MTEKDIQNAYKLTFGNEMGKEVIRDLDLFCKGSITSFTSATKEDNSLCPYQVVRMEGRREVLTKIMIELKIDINDFFDDYVTNEGDGID